MNVASCPRDSEVWGQSTVSRLSWSQVARTIGTLPCLLSFNETEKFGRKIQNWHRPLGRFELSQRFRRLRYQDDEIRRFLREDERLAYDYYDYYDWADAEDLRCSRLNAFLRDLLGRRSLLGADFETLDAWTERPHADLEERLATFFDLSSNHDLFEDLLLTVALEMGDSPIPLAIRRIERKKPLLAKRLCLFSPFWIRSPQTWRGNSADSLLRHLFVRYDVPRCLYSTWKNEPDLLQFKWPCWFILLGQGGSLQRAAKRFPWRCFSRLPQYLSEAPASATAEQACMFAEIKRLGGSHLEYEWVNAHRSFALDPTEEGDARWLEFWQGAVRWLVKHRDALDDETAYRILNWGLHEYTECEPPRLMEPVNGARGERIFTWKGRGLNRTLEHSRQYQQHIEGRRPRSSPQRHWQKRNLDWEFTEGEDVWTFVELTSSEQLAEEGREMHHCVGGYSESCYRGYSAIVSLRCQGERQITLEIRLDARQVVQARGACNRNPNASEKKIIGLWRKTALAS